MTSVKHPETENKNPIETPETSKHHLNRRRAIIGAISLVSAGAVVAVGAVLLPHGSKEHAAAEGNNPTPDDRQTSETSSPISTPTPEHSAITTPTSTPEVAAPVDSFEIPAGLSSEDYSKATIGNISKSLMTGTSEKLQKDWLSASGAEARKAVLRNQAEVSAEKICNDMFVSDWQSKESLPRFKEKLVELIYIDLDHWAITYNSDYPDDHEPWSRSFSYDTQTEVGKTNDGRTIDITGIEHNNATKNRLGTIDPKQLENDGLPFTFEFTTKVENGTERIDSWKNIGNLDDPYNY